MRKNPTDESLKPQVAETKIKVRSLSIILSVKQKIEELTNYANSQQNQSENIELQIDVYECQDFEEEEEEEMKSSESIIGNYCNEIMENAVQMPECFEKSLVRICYLLNILKNNLSNSDEKKVNGGHILNIKTKEEVLKSIDNDLI